MLNINSISVAPWPQQAATAKASPISTAKASNVVSKDNTGSAVSVVSSGEVGQAQAAFVPSALPPVNPAKEAVGADMLKNAAAPERSGGVAAVVSAQVRGRSNSSVNEAAETDDAQQASAAGGTAQATTEDPAAAASSRVASNAQVMNAEITRQAESNKRASAIGDLPTDPKDPVAEAMETQIKEFLPNLWKASRAAVDVLIGEEAKAAAAERAARFDEGLADAASAVAEMVAQEASESYKAQAADAAQTPAPGSRVSKLV
jgi:hypothetical protein